MCEGRIGMAEGLTDVGSHTGQTPLIAKQRNPAQRAHVGLSEAGASGRGPATTNPGRVGGGCGFEHRQSAHTGGTTEQGGRAGKANEARQHSGTCAAGWRGRPAAFTRSTSPQQMKQGSVWNGGRSVTAKPQSLKASKHAASGRGSRAYTHVKVLSRSQT